MSWRDLSDDELQARLERRCFAGYARQLVRDRDDEASAREIDAILEDPL